MGRREHFDAGASGGYTREDVIAAGNDPFPPHFHGYEADAHVRWHVEEIPVRSQPMKKIMAEHASGESQGNGDIQQVQSILKKGPRTMPPVLADKDRRVFDGGHRLHAHVLAGEKTIRAFVPRRVDV